VSEQKLPLASRFAALEYKLFDAMRHKRAFEIAEEKGTARDFEHFRGARQALIVTFKRSGEAVPTPVNFGLSDDGKIYFRSEPHVAKLRRIRNNPRVRVCPCSMRGKPTGELAEGVARILPESENERALAVIEANWRPEVKVIERGIDRVGITSAYVELAPA
jgi:PPOX class probable F420-dependent enzyme